VPGCTVLRLRQPESGPFSALFFAMRVTPLAHNSAFAEF